VAQFAVGQGEQVVCSWYVIPFDLQGGTGTISLTVQLCPTADTPVEECQFLTELDGAITISGPVELSTDTALNHDVSWYWGEDFALPFGLYALSVSELTPPDGYTLDRVDGTFGGSEIGWTFELTAGQPDAILNVVFVPITGEAGEEDSAGA
jgi:hypothetical protein